ncbi:BatD family protein [Cognatiluteimonas weifangensis]|uniref:Protein BatD n=1 Tax=Cognatiluteimonas weifangensis TaxID=2303539 RepID=A0A372DRG7_9GAMM|nr:BatD family protein [Luteimonas weifangensis]RFP61987.1 protein BatD [Luteimonas weifangensis]
MPRRFSAFVMVLLLSALSWPAPTQTRSQAQAPPLRAWLDRDRIALGETATLNIEVEQADADAPDWSPLLGEFRLSGHTSSRSFEYVNGVGRARTLFAVALQPRREGAIGIPGLRVGSRRTPPLTLTVTPPAATPARAGSAVFIEAEADAQQPYVQQAVGYTVRLYYATPLISGQLDQAAPDGASLRRIGEDVQYAREIAGRRYTVVERHYLLIPERSGPLAVPGAQFRGRGAGGFFDDLFGDGQSELQAGGPPRMLTVRAIPASAPQPWLPLHALALRWQDAPRQARAGAALAVTVEATVDGATAAQLPELQLPAIPGAQVFADPPQADEVFAGGRPQVTLTRRFEIVPAQAGTLRIAGPELSWWDVRAGRARTATLPELSVQVAPAIAASGNASVAAAPVPAGAAGADRDWVRVPGVQGRVRPWALATVAFALLWLITLMWGLHRQPHPAAVAAADADAVPPSAPAAPAHLRRALDGGDLGEIAAALCALAQPPVADLDAVQARLDDARQRDAVDALQRARWGGGDAAAARTALRAAFRPGPRWRRPAARSVEALPPLYPPR